MSQSSSHPSVTAQEAKQKVDEGYAYIDVRSDDEVEAGHPSGAYHVPIRVQTDMGTTEDNEDFVEVMTACFGKDAKLVIGCKSGPRSLLAAQKLVAAGFSNVIDNRAGYAGTRDAFGSVADIGWQAAGFPVSKDLEPGHSYEELKERAGK